MTKLHMNRMATTIIAILLAALATSLGTGLPAAWANSANDTGTSVATPLTASGVTESDDETATDDAMPCGITYQTKLVGNSWQSWKSDGESAGATKGAKKLESFKIKLTGDETGSVQYQTHVSTVGWTSTRSNGKTAGIAGEKHPVNAIRIALTGDISKTYNVYYRVNTKDTGWQSWKKNGTVAGKASSTCPVRAIQVKLVKKEAASSTSSTGIVGVRYRSNMNKSGWTTYAANNEAVGVTKKHQRLKAFHVYLDSGAYSGSIKYRVRLNDGTWKAWKQNGQSSGTYKSIEALKIKLTGPIAKKYDVVYRVYVHGIGWQRRMRNGEVAGTRGQNLQIESLKIELVPKSKASGWVKNDGTWSYYSAGKKQKNKWVVTKEHPIDLTAQGEKRYWIDATGSLAVSRYVNPKTANDSNSGWTAYATPSGYVAVGKYTNEDGILLAGETGRLHTQSRWINSKEFDGTDQRYRLVKKGVCAVVQTGLFKVNGKLYYGWEDGRGYLMRSDTQYIDGTWYKANAKGVLKSVYAEIIERYVQWAIDIANDDSHGYSQANRWGPDYDCSSLVCAAILAAGFPDSGASWTGNMRSCLKKVGFVWHEGTAGLKRGDIMLVHNSNRQHTEIYLGNNSLVGAHIAETGGIYGEAGDQTGREICVTSYYDAPWEGYLRYKSVE